MQFLTRQLSNLEALYLQENWVGKAGEANSYLQFKSNIFVEKDYI